MNRAPIAKTLSGGDPRSLGRAEKVVELVLESPGRLAELFECLWSEDETLRMRASDALEKVCRRRPELLVPFTRRLLPEVPKIPQPSVQWHLAQILAGLPLHGDDRRRAIAVLRRDLARYDDWIVTNLTLEALASFARPSPRMHKSFARLLMDYVNSPYKSVAKRAGRILAEFAQTGSSQT